jgi:hypothetical protein
MLPCLHEFSNVEKQRRYYHNQSGHITKPLSHNSAAKKQSRFRTTARPKNKAAL